MSRDLRQLLDTAAGETSPEVLGAEDAMRRGVRLRWRRRFELALPIMLAIALTLTITRQIPGIDDAKEIAPADQRERPTETVAAKTPAPKSQHREAGDVEAARTRAAEARRSSEAPPAIDTSPACFPLITDTPGESRHPAADILRSDIRYEIGTNTLIFEHVLKDIPEDTVQGADVRPGHRVEGQAVYELNFTWDGLEYTAEAFTNEAGQEMYGVHRDRRGDAEPGDEEYVEIASATGRMNHETDTVTLRVKIDDFNRGEKQASQDEGGEPAADLTRGSKLTDIHLWAYAYEAGNYVESYGEDRAYARCDYIVGG